MNYIIENWVILIAVIALLTALGSAIFIFVKQPSEKQLAKVKAWLLLAVVEAEKELGSGTGKIKLRFVYDLFIMRFKWISRLITFDMFSSLVDEALEEMKELLKTNHSIRLFVEGE